MKFLIYGTGYFYDEASVELCKIWARLVRYLNPDQDIWLFDAASPFNPEEFLPKRLEIEVYRFKDNIGHLARGGADGAGRSFIQGLMTAVSGDYDYAIHYEADVLFAKPFAPILDKIDNAMVRVAALPLGQYQFPGFEVSIWNTSWVSSSKFIERYDWLNAPRFPIPEIRLKLLTEDALFLLPLAGLRNDQRQANSMNLSSMFPYGPPDWITRIVEPDLAYRFLQLNGINLP